MNHLGLRDLRLHGCLGLGRCLGLGSLRLCCCLLALCLGCLGLLGLPHTARGSNPDALHRPLRAGHLVFPVQPHSSEKTKTPNHPACPGYQNAPWACRSWVCRSLASAQHTSTPCLSANGSSWAIHPETKALYTSCLKPLPGDAVLSRGRVRHARQHGRHGYLGCGRLLLLCGLLQVKKAEAAVSLGCQVRSLNIPRSNWAETSAAQPGRGQHNAQ